MKLFYTIIFLIFIGGLNAQGIEMEYEANSPSLTLRATYDSLENKGGKVLEGGSAFINLERTDEDQSAIISFDLTTIDPAPVEGLEELIGVKKRWTMGINGDERFKFVHYSDDLILDLDFSSKSDVLILDASEEGTSVTPIVQMPQGRLDIGDDIKLYGTSENRLSIAGGDVVPISSFAGLGIKHYDLGKDGLLSHWDDVVANEFVTYSFLPDVVLAKSKTSSMEILGDINTYQSRAKKVGETDRMMLNPKELLKIFPEALHQHDIEYLADGSSKVVKIENPGIIYDRFIPLLIDGMQEQKELIDKQAAYIETIEARLEKLEAQ